MQAKPLISVAHTFWFGEPDKKQMISIIKSVKVGYRAFINRVVMEDLSDKVTFGWRDVGNEGVRRASIGLRCSRQKDLQVQRPWGGLCLAYSENSQETHVAGAE